MIPLKYCNKPPARYKAERKVWQIRFNEDMFECLVRIDRYLNSACRKISSATDVAHTQKEKEKNKKKKEKCCKL